MIFDSALLVHFAALNISFSQSNQDILRVVCRFVADGRFHLESMMIHNPQVKAFYRYGLCCLRLCECVL